MTRSIRIWSLGLVTLLGVAVTTSVGSASRRVTGRVVPGVLVDRGPVAPIGAGVGPRTALLPGQRVQVEWHGQWWRGEVLAVIPDGRVVVHYTGWGRRWDELVGRRRLRLGGTASSSGDEVPAYRGPIAPTGKPVGSSTPLRIGAPVQVEWQGSWWRGRIIALRAGAVRIHYVGWDSGWDEWVARARLRHAAPGDNRGATTL